VETEQWGCVSSTQIVALSTLTREGFMSRHIVVVSLSIILGTFGGFAGTLIAKLWLEDQRMQNTYASYALRQRETLG